MSLDDLKKFVLTKFLKFFFVEKRAQHCDGTNRDIVFVLDQSGRFGSWQSEVPQKFMHDLVGQLGAKSRFALITFGDESDAQVNFNYLTEDHPESEIRTGIDQMKRGAATKQ